ncbi:MAG: hypothetical protein IJS94_01075, partial [Clostridia bacterium]|nr:hypothetical protein [Clostridia bacterium]
MKREVNSMLMDAVLDREYDENVHYISPGCFCFTFDNGKTIKFDFLWSRRIVDPKDKTRIIFELSALDDSYNPVSENLGNLLTEAKIDSIDEFYFFTGEKEDPKIKVKEVSSVIFNLDECLEVMPGVNQLMDFTSVRL